MQDSYGAQMMNFLVDMVLNHHDIMIILFFLFVLGVEIYVRYFLVRNVRDEWFEEVNMIKLLRGKKSYGLIGTHIDLDKDISMVMKIDEENHLRVFKGEV